jgi:hypothetical protein
MDPIHPIVPASSNPAAVDRVRRVTRSGDEEPRHEQPQHRKRAPPPRVPEAPAAVTGDGHIDALA